MSNGEFGWAFDEEVRFGGNSRQSEDLSHVHARGRRTAARKSTADSKCEAEQIDTWTMPVGIMTVEEYNRMLRGEYDPFEEAKRETD